MALANFQTCFFHTSALSSICFDIKVQKRQKATKGLPKVNPNIDAVPGGHFQAYFRQSNYAKNGKILITLHSPQCLRVLIATLVVVFPMISMTQCSHTGIFLTSVFHETNFIISSMQDYLVFIILPHCFNWCLVSQCTLFPNCFIYCNCQIR